MNPPTVLLLRLVRAQWPRYAMALAFAALPSLLFLLVPVRLGGLVQALSHVPRTGPISVPWAMVLEVVALLLAQSACVSVYTYLSSVASEQIGLELRRRFFVNVVGMSVDATVGQENRTASQLISDIAIVQGGVSTNVVTSVRNAVIVGGSLVVMLSINPRIALACFGLIAANAVLMWMVFTRITKSSLEIQSRRSAYTALFTDACANAYVIQAYRSLGHFGSRFTGLLEAANASMVRNLRMTALTTPLAQLVFLLSFVVILRIGAREIELGRISVSGFVAITAYIALILSSAGKLSSNSGRVRRAAMIVERNRRFLEAPAAPVPAGTPGRHMPTPTPATVELTGVGYLYPGAVRYALEGVTATFPAGSFTTIVGKSGAGKSTLIALLAGLLTPSQGKIRIDGEGLASVLVVPQRPCLMAGTIAENIRFGLEDMPDAAVIEAAQRAQIHDFVMSLPDGYDEVVVAGARNLSRGQQQRIALARALARHPAVLLLDEATASLDPAAEAEVLRVLRRLSGRVTIVAVAHSSRFEVHADNVVLLEDGRVTVRSAHGRAHEPLTVAES